VRSIRFRLFAGLIISYVAGIYLAIIVLVASNCLVRGLSRCMMNTSGTYSSLGDKFFAVLIVSALAFAMSFRLLLVSAALAMVFARSIVKRPAAWCIAASIVVPIALLAGDFVERPDPRGLDASMRAYAIWDSLAFLFVFSGACALTFFAWLRMFVKPALLPDPSQG
jgi:hypothetical protein